MKKRATLTTVTAEEQNEQNRGSFSANGSSTWTRRAAHPDHVNLHGGKRTDGRLIRETERELQKLAKGISLERNPERLSKLRKNHAIKTAFLKRVIEHNRKKINIQPVAASGPREPEHREQIEDLYGDDPLSFVPWDQL